MCAASAAIVDLDEEMTRVVVPVRVQGVARWTAVLASSAGAAHGTSRVELDETHRTVR